MLLHPEVFAFFKGPWLSETAAKRAGRLQSDLESFAKGEVVSMALTPREHGNAYMGRLEPLTDATWDIRSRDPSPGLRVFGRFAKKDVFVALVWELRSKNVPWSDKRPLGDGDSTEYQIALLETEARWRAIFKETPALTGVTASDYVSKDTISC